MAYAAAVTSRINVGCRVFCIDYHLPFVLIKLAMTVDMLSGGRLELGLGAGWIENEYAALGIRWIPPRVRVDRLADVIEGVKCVRMAGAVNLKNDSLTWRGFEALPKPAGRAPLMIGGGSPRILRLAGREADIVSLNFNNPKGMISSDGVSLSTEAETFRKIDWVREGASHRFDELEPEIGAYFTNVTDNPVPVVEAFAKAL